VIKSHYAGSALRQVGAQAKNRNSQDVIDIQRELSVSLNRNINGEFVIPDIMQLSSEDKFNMSLAFIGPWTGLPTIIATSPSGKEYSSIEGEDVISQKWSKNVFTFMTLFKIPTSMPVFLF
jgi:hypothetical protein